MERIDQPRIIRKSALEKFLKQIKSNPKPKASLEQYPTAIKTAAKILHLIAYSNSDILEKTVLDLGCGTGRLSLGAAFLGAQQVLGIDIDKNAIKMANKYAHKFNLEKKLSWITGDISTINGQFDTVLQNPPFGIQKRFADRKFLKKALEVGKRIYSIHSHPLIDKNLIKHFKKNPETIIQVIPSAFLNKYVEKNNGSVRAVYSMLMSIPRLFSFHKKQKYSIIIDLYLIERN
jgi:putative methylase